VTKQTTRPRRLRRALPRVPGHPLGYLIFFLMFLFVLTSRPSGSWLDDDTPKVQLPGQPDHPADVRSSSGQPPGPEARRSHSGPSLVLVLLNMALVSTLVLFMMASAARRVARTPVPAPAGAPAVAPVARAGPGPGLALVAGVALLWILVSLAMAVMQSRGWLVELVLVAALVAFVVHELWAAARGRRHIPQPKEGAGRPTPVVPAYVCVAGLVAGVLLLLFVVAAARSPGWLPALLVMGLLVGFVVWQVRASVKGRGRMNPPR